MIRQRDVLYAIGLLGLLALSGCSLVTTTLDRADSGTIQILHVGEVLEIRLDGNASTGHEWLRAAPSTLDEAPLRPIEEGTYCSHGLGLAGEPGRYVFRYRAMAQGTIALSFEYRRPWEAEPPVDTFTVTVWVR